jgi:DNA ligase 4
VCNPPDPSSPRLALILWSFGDRARGDSSSCFLNAGNILRAMTLLFMALCKLWEELSHASNAEDRNRLVQRWFQRHNLDIQRRGPSALALLSCLFPHKRPDRVYGWREKKLISIIVHAWGLGSSRRDELYKLQNEGSGLDFASTIRAAVEEGGESVTLQNMLTVEEVSCTLDRLASTCDFSSPQVRRGDAGKVVNARQELIRLFRRLCDLEVEWMIRLVFKDLSPARVPEATMMQLFHPSLAWALQIRSSLSGAMELLEPLISKEDSSSSTAPAISDANEATMMQPQTGTMVGLPVFEKARSIKHSCQLVGRKEVSVERKYDGEYCQVHVSLQADNNSTVTIFSKSGRNSTGCHCKSRASNLRSRAG